MSVEIHPSGTGQRFYCTTSERLFGPEFTDFEEAERFQSFLGADPRNFKLEQLERLYANWNKLMDEAYHDGWNDARKQQGA